MKTRNMTKKGRGRGYPPSTDPFECPIQAWFWLEWDRDDESYPLGATSLISVPIGSMVMRISSPLSSVNESGGTIPVPVIRPDPHLIGGLEGTSGAGAYGE